MRKLTALYDGDIDLSDLSDTNIKNNASIYSYGELNVNKNIHIGQANKSVYFIIKIILSKLLMMITLFKQIRFHTKHQ